ncbi:MAG: M1 family aminopeptidase [Terriglobales bacterium]|jgi:ABC-type transport system involved in multi-copper enzyme maturation permease subunit
MFLHIAWFEIRYWLRSWMLWIFTLIIAAMIFGATSSDHIQIGGALSNTYRNAPYVIENYYAIIGLLALLMVTAFVNSAAARDFSHNTYQIVFTTPLRRRDFLLGRFFGATLVSVIPMLGVSIGILLAKYMPWVEPERWEHIIWSAHLKGVLVFAVPNAFFMAAILFTIAVLARNEIVSFVGALLLLTGYGVSAALLSDIEREHIAALLDPFGVRTFALATKYWTVAEKNTISLGLSGLMFWNRLLWIGVGVLFLIFAYSRFSFAERRQKARKVREAPEPVPTSVVLPTVTCRATSWEMYISAVKIHLLGIFKGTVFIVILIAGLLNCVPSVAMNAREGYGNSTLPVTYWLLEMIAGSLYLFLIALITYYAGVLIWKDRDAHMDEITDSLPVPEWISYAARFTALAAMVMLVQFLALVSGVIVQASYGYHRYQLGLYLNQLFVRDLTLFFFLGVFAFFIHVLSPNKYVGYFAYIAFLIVNLFIWRPLNVSSNLVQFASTPNVTYSDLFGDKPYITAWRWFALYWILFCGLLAIATVMFWPRGKQARWAERWRIARLRFSSPWPALALVCLASFAATGGWIFYNTEVLNEVIGPKDQLAQQADYEKNYKQFDRLPQPRVRSDKYWVDIFPETRNVTMRAQEELYNPFPQPLTEIHYSVDRRYDTDIQIPGATLAKNDTRLSYRIYRFTPPLQPGESRTAVFIVKSKNRGFEDSVSNVEIAQNGTFFNNSVAPVIGYDTSRELTDPNDRRKYGLGEQQLMRPLERNCTDDCRDSYIRDHSDWADLETVISTSSDQIAIAPGSLVREWQENGRRYFYYKLDHPSLRFYSFMSGRYEVQREEWNGVRLEVYYDKDHPWNVPRMMKSLKKSLEYYTQNFGPYYHKEARIIEFPRVAQFAQAFAGTMPYSESIGFIANLNHPDDIDMVYYVVAHETGHQWWAHQVVGADMQGATFLSESLAQYSALMVMEKEYGRDMMRKFLKYEMDNYLRSRGRERHREEPLLTVESGQGYVHYRKASVVLYYLKEMIGEDAVNRALRKVIKQYAYNAPPYPTSYALVDALREETPPHLQYLIKDLFEDITLFSNRTLEATAVKRPDGKYDVTINVETHKYKADAKGNETEVAMDDWIDIGAFAKPEKGRKYGKTLYRERVHIANNKSSYTFTTAELPDEAGVDPFLLLIDRIPDDNTKKVTMTSTSSAVSTNQVHGQ